MTFRKSDQSFLRIELSDKDGVNQKRLRHYNASMPATITIRTDGYKTFQNITVETQVGFQIECEYKELEKTMLLSKQNFRFSM